MSLTGHLDKLNRCGIIKTQKRGEIKIDRDKILFVSILINRMLSALTFNNNEANV